MNDLVPKPSTEVAVSTTGTAVVKSEDNTGATSLVAPTESNQAGESQSHPAHRQADKTHRSRKRMLPPSRGYERIIALRYLRPRGDGFVSLISVISLLGIMLGVATLIVVLAVLNGFRIEVRDKILGINGHVVVRGAGGKIQTPDDLTQQLMSISGAQSVRAFTETTILASSRSNATGALMRGITAGSLLTTPVLSELLPADHYEVIRQGKAILIGNTMATILGVSVGDRINIVVPRGVKTPFGTMPRLKSFEIGGIFHLGFSQFDRGLVLINLDTSQKLLEMGTSVSALEVTLDDPDAAPQFAADTKEALTEEPLYVSAWQELNRTFFQALKTERNVMFLVLMLIILIAALNVVSGMVMLVKEKNREIALLRTIGVGRMAIARIFFFSGGVIALFGTVSGLFLGLLICANIENIQTWMETLTGGDLFASEVYYLSSLPAIVDPGETTIVVVSTLLLTLVTAVLPALRAARTDPVEALRNV